MKLLETIRNTPSNILGSLSQLKNWSYQKFSSIPAKDYAKYAALTLTTASAAYLLYTQAPSILSNLGSQQESLPLDTCALSEKVSVINNASLPVCPFLNPICPSNLSEPSQLSQLPLNTNIENSSLVPSLKTTVQETLDLAVCIDNTSAIERLTTRIQKTAITAFTSTATLVAGYVVYTIRNINNQLARINLA